MASFSKELPLKYKNLDYQGVINNYEWMLKTISSIFANIEKPTFDISFNLGNISCSYDSIEEFSNHAYGQIIHVFLYELSFYQQKDENTHAQIAHIFINASCETFTVHCDSKKVLIDICTAFEKSMNPNPSPPESQTQINNYIHNESTHVTIGDNNNIQNTNIGKNNTVHTENPTPKKSFWKSVLQNITANGLWVALGVILLALLTYLGVTNREWMNLF